MIYGLNLLFSSQIRLTYARFKYGGFYDQVVKVFDVFECFHLQRRHKRVSLRYLMKEVRQVEVETSHTCPWQLIVVRSYTFPCY